MLRRSYDNVRVHFTNIASGEAIESIKAAQNDGLEVSFSFIFIVNISDIFNLDSFEVTIGQYSFISKGNG